MAGQPNAKARREANRRGRFSASQRIAAVRAAEVEGVPVVAQRIGITQSTLRGWKHLLNKAGRPVAGSKAQQFARAPLPADVAPVDVYTRPVSQSPVAHPPVGDGDQTRIVEPNPFSPDSGACDTDTAPDTPADSTLVLQQTALEQRRLAADCMSQARDYLALGEAVKVQQLSAAGQKFAQQAAELENTVQAHLEARPRITQAQLGELERRLRGFLKALAARTGHDLDPDRNPDCASELQHWFNGPTPHTDAHGDAEHAQDAPNGTDTPDA